MARLLTQSRPLQLTAARLGGRNVDREQYSLAYFIDILSFRRPVFREYCDVRVSAQLRAET
jgi:hypothetical protein